MIFSDEQKRDHIKELQRFLYEISFYNSSIPTIIPDGIYGSDTKEAVTAFQREYGIPVTGSADFDTWEKLVEIWQIYYPVILLPDIFRKETVLIPGSAGAAVYLAQHMLNTIGRKYANPPIVELTGIYDAPTEQSVNAFKSVTQNKENSEGINARLWNDIVSKFNKIVI